MITFKEICEAFDKIIVFYPTFYKAAQDDEEWKKIIKAWHEIFKNYDSEKFRKAVYDYIKTDTSGRPPWAGALLQIMHNGNIPETRFVQTGVDDEGNIVGYHERI